MVPADLAPGEGTVPGWPVPFHYACPISLTSLLIWALIPSRDPTILTSSNPNHLPQAPSPTTITMGLGASTYDFCRDKCEARNSVPSGSASPMLCHPPFETQARRTVSICSIAIHHGRKKENVMDEVLVLKASALKGDLSLFLIFP